MAWYPGQSRSVLLVKDPTSIGENAMTKLLSEWERFASTIFLCHLRGAARNLQEQDTQPFVMSYARRDWALAHNGDLFVDLTKRLPLREDPSFEPLGSTDSEHAFCWLLEYFRTKKVRSLSELGWGELAQIFHSLDELGTANFLLTDGVDIAAYSDNEGYNPLHWARSTPPHPQLLLESEDILINLDDAMDRNRTVVMVATRPMSSNHNWTSMKPGQLLILRQGAIIYNSHASGQFTMRTGNGSIPSLPRPRALSRTDVQPNRVLSVLHETRYNYKNSVERSSHLLRLKPVHDLYQQLLEHESMISVAGLRRDFEDVFGNQAISLDLENSYYELRLLSRSLVRISVPPASHLPPSSYRIALPLVWMPWQRQMMLPYLLPPELPETQLTELYEYALSFVRRQDSDLVQALLDMSMTIHRDFSYVSGSTTLATTPFDVYCNRRGVCQDFANLMICLARLLNIPARYRVGYIYMDSHYGSHRRSEASHAWVEVYLPRVGWQGFDPTHGCLAGPDHIRVACGRNYRDATPTGGTIYKGGGEETLSISVHIEDVTFSNNERLQL